MFSMESIPDCLGYLILSEDNTILSSGGDLENAEHLTSVVPVLISLCGQLKQEEECYSKISVVYKDHSYIICMSNRKIYVVKKVFHSPLLVDISTDGDTSLQSQHSTNSVSAVNV